MKSYITLKVYYIEQYNTNYVYTAMYTNKRVRVPVHGND